MIQGSQEWLEFRKDKIGASDAPVIMGISPWKKPLKLWEEKVGLKDDKISSYVMRRGLEMEPLAREYFNSMLDLDMQPYVTINFNYPWMMASLDGYDAKNNLALEIKCPGKVDHDLALQGKIPEKYYAQLQHQMCVMDLNEIYYVSFDGLSGPILQVKRDQNYIDLLLEKEINFVNCIESFTPPS